jgi:uncharacterized protein (DUF1697 family)
LNRYVALLRAVNVGGTGKLSMADLRAIATAAGFTRVATYIASGNLLFESPLSEGAVKAILEARLESHMGKRVPILVRTSSGLSAIVASNPFVDAHGSRHMVFFYDAPPPDDLIARCRDIKGERLALGLRELHVDYGDGIRHTRLKIPGQEDRTGRNINTVAKLAAMLSD